MFNNVALNVVIGLVFIYLLYSLLATVLSEIIATYIGLRARNLKEAVDRMLNDDEDDKGFFSRLWDSLKLTKNPKNPRIDKFYSNPEIKYLGSTGIFKNPSAFKAVTFSRTLLYELNGKKPLNKDVIKAEIQHSIDPDKYTRLPKEEVTDDSIPTLDKQTAEFVLSLYNDSYGDLVKFKLQIEAWFDRTMEQCTEWYKRKIQIVLLVLGFMLAWFFNADTFSIIGKLSTDKDARNNLVSMATAYVGAHPDTPNASNFSLTEAQRDSLYQVKKQLEEDIVKANTILGTGGWLPDTVEVFLDSKSQKTYTPLIDAASLSEIDKKIEAGNKISFSPCEKWSYFFRLVSHHFFGFLITAIAISLGAPFWFDLLNKLMKLRTSVKQDMDSTNTTAGGYVLPLNREA
jgi:hypothetical protein